MVNMEVSIISRDTIKPLSSSLHQLKPHKLSILDQLTPMTYVPAVIFYSIVDPNFNVPQTLTHLKNSLSQTLNLYYPFSGRVKNNLYIDDFGAGVPYLETRVQCGMLEFFNLKETELLNRFIPFHPFYKKTNDIEKLPLFAVQVNLFACGGIGLGFSLSHKIADGQTSTNFLQSWVCIFRGSYEKIVLPNLSQASSIFPPRDSLPQKFLDIIDSWWFKEDNYVTRRFVFDSKAISTLRAKATSEHVPKPTRVQVLTCFIWKHAMAASQALSGRPKISILEEAVNLRPRMKPQMSSDVIGNVFWVGQAVADGTTATHELCDLVNLLNEAVKELNNDYLETLQGAEGYEEISAILNMLEEIVLSEAEIYKFTSWTSTPLTELDFGWGSPSWAGLMGKAGPAFRNFTVFVEQQWGNGIEAWVTLEEKQMAVLEKDPQFLAFASLNPHFLFPLPSKARASSL